jgi:hypothetical protein
MPTPVSPDVSDDDDAFEAPQSHAESVDDLLSERRCVVCDLVRVC